MPLNAYEEYLTDVKNFSFDIEIGIFENESDYEKYREYYSSGKPEFEKVFVGYLDEKLKRKIKSYIDTQSFKNFERLDLEINADGIKHHTISFGKPKYDKGLYFTTVGYQKGGMVEKFWDEFSEYSFYGQKTDFERAFNYLNTGWAERLQSEAASKSLIENFKMSFIDKFELGKSLLAV